jgi:hypothetical protein
MIKKTTTHRVTGILGEPHNEKSFFHFKKGGQIAYKGSANKRVRPWARNVA